MTALAPPFSGPIPLARNPSPLVGGVAGFAVGAGAGAVTGAALTASKKGVVIGSVLGSVLGMIGGTLYGPRRGFVAVAVGGIAAVGAATYAYHQYKCSGNWLTNRGPGDPQLDGDWYQRNLRADFPGLLTSQQVAQLREGDEVSIVMGNRGHVSDRPTDVFVTRARIFRAEDGELFLAPRCFQRTPLVTTGHLIGAPDEQAFIGVSFLPADTQQPVTPDDVFVWQAA